MNIFFIILLKMPNSILSIVFFLSLILRFIQFSHIIFQEKSVNTIFIFL